MTTIHHKFLRAFAPAVPLASRIPNALTFTTAGLAIVFHLLAPTGAGGGHAIGGLLAGLALFFPLFALGAMGADDVKLMAALGAWIGFTSIVDVALYGSVAGGVFALIVALRKRYLREALRNLRMLGRHWRVHGLKPYPALTLESTRCSACRPDSRC